MTATAKAKTPIWKILAWSLLGLIALVVAAIVFLVVWIDPNDYRDDASALVKEKTGLILKIDGNIGWNFYPALGFSVEGVSLATGEGEKPLAGVGKAVVAVELLPLFSQQVRVRTLLIDGATASLVVAPDGKGNWEALTAGGDAPAEDAPTPETAGEPLLVSVPKVVITNAVFEYEDQQTNAHVMAMVKELTVEDVGLGKEFPLHLVAKISANNSIDVDFTLDTLLTLDTEAQRYSVRGLDLKAAIAGVLDKPFNVALGAEVVADLGANKIDVPNLAVTVDGIEVAGAQAFGASVNGPLALDLAADTASVGPMNFSAVGISGALAVNVKDLSKELSYSGTLDVQPFNAKNVMRTFGIAAPATSDPMAMTKVALKTAFDGTFTRAMLNNLDISLDDTHVRGSAGITDVATTALAFNLALDSINADRYLPPPTPAGAAPTAAAAAGKPEPLLPMETLRTLNIDGKFTAGKIVAMELPMTNLATAVKAKNGNIHLDPLNASVLEGTLRGSVQVDARGAEPRIVTHLVLDRVEVGGLVKRFAGKDLFNGKVSLKLDADATGNDVDTLMKKTIGGLDLNVVDATLKGMNLSNELNTALTQKLGAFSMLVPDYKEKLSNEMQKDTVFSALAARATLKDGVAETPSLNAAMKDGAIKGGGKFNIITMDFDYNLAMTTTKLADNKYFANAEFPVRCKGNIGGAPASWCRPDGDAINGMLKKAAGSALKDRVQSELAGKLGIPAGGGVKQELNKEVKDAKKEAEQKGKEELKQELNRALKNLF